MELIKWCDGYWELNRALTVPVKTTSPLEHLFLKYLERNITQRKRIQTYWKADHIIESTAY